MDRRFNPLPLNEQVALREQAVQDVLAHPEWPLPQALRHIRQTLRLTAQDMGRLAEVSYRTVQDIENGRSAGNVQTVDRLLGVLGLRLGIVRPSELP